MLFREEDLDLIRFEDKVKANGMTTEIKTALANDWKLELYFGDTANIYSLANEARFNISSANLMEIINSGVLRNGFIEGNFRALKFKGDFFLLKEGTPEYDRALSNSVTKKAILKTGGIYDIRLNRQRMKNIKNGKKDLSGLIEKAIFLGSFVHCKTLVASKSEFGDFRVYCPTTVYLFFIGKEIYIVENRYDFDLVKFIGIDNNYINKEENLQNINNIYIDKFKNNIAVVKSITQASGAILFLNKKDKENSIKNNNNLQLEIIKKLVKYQVDLIKNQE